MYSNFSATARNESRYIAEASDVTCDIRRIGVGVEVVVFQASLCRWGYVHDGRVNCRE
jgi:hypothetical protein